MLQRSSLYQRGGTQKQTGRRIDMRVLVLFILLLLAGMLALFSASYYTFQDSGDAYAKVRQQVYGIALGTVAMAVCSRMDYHFFRKPWVILTMLAISAVLLVLVVIPGVGVLMNGSRRWLNIAGLSFQPSEFAKFAMILFMASSLTNKGKQVRKFFSGLVPMLMVPGVMFLLILEQPNLSTAMSILIVAFVMIAIAGARTTHLGVLGVCGAALGAWYAWSEPYRRERLLSFRDPFAQMSDEGYQLSQSLIAFGSGGLFGMGLGQGRQKTAYLPYPESDFIFASIAEDFGLFGCILVVALFVAFVYAGLRVALRCPDKFGCLLAAGITAMIGVQAFLNMGVVVGLLPTTGLPLPFFSAGGTSVSIFMAAVGVLLSISREDEMRVR
ncbi:MAG: putative lipid II flippase FtsW [Firmicutes bacterium]|nr:putative lipid II flippase FtsW [Bacillota bacterium]